MKIKKSKRVELSPGKKLSEYLQELPYSNDRIGQAFVRHIPSVSKGKDETKEKNSDRN